MTESNSMADHTQWRVLAGQLVALARLVDVQLEHSNYLPAELAGAFLEAASVTLERYEAVVTRVGRTMSGQLTSAEIEDVRTAMFQLRNARATLGALASTLDPARPRPWPPVSTQVPKTAPGSGCRV